MTSIPKTETENDREWIIEALDTYEGPLIRYAQRFTGDLEQARDIVQDAFLRLCRADRSRIGEQVGAWLYTVCRNRALDVQRKEKRMGSWNEQVALARPSADPPPEAVAARNDDYRSVLSALSGLPPNQQEVVHLRFQDGLSYHEISEVTGLSVSNVGYLLHMAVKRVRELLADAAEPSPRRDASARGAAEGRA